MTNAITKFHVELTLFEALQGVLNFFIMIYIDISIKMAYHINEMGMFTNTKKIFKYIDNNQIARISKILKSTDLKNQKNNAGNTLLIHAVIKNNSEIVTLLLQGGANPDISNEILRNNNYTYPLHVAASGDHHEIVKLLLEYNAKPDVEDIKALTPLHRACKFGSYLSAKELITAGAKVDAITVFNTQPLHYAAERGYTKIVELLLKHGAPINGIENDESPPLYWAVKGLHIKTAALLINQGAASDFLKLTQLQKKLLSGKNPDFHGKNLNETDIFGRTILFYTIASGKTNLTETLIELGCNRDIKDIYEIKADDYLPLSTNI